MILHQSTSAVHSLDARAERNLNGQPAEVYLSFRRDTWQTLAFAVMSAAEARTAAARLVAAADAADALDVADAAAQAAQVAA